MSKSTTRRNSLVHLLHAANVVLLFAMLACLLFLAGCQKSTAVAEPRNSEFKPSFEPIATAPIPTNTSVDTQFLNEDHFVCISVDVNKLRSNDDLSEVPWDDLSTQLGMLLGSDNGSLTRLERVWIVVDRGAIESIMGGGETASSPAVFVFDFARPFDVDQLAAATEKRLKDHQASMAVDPDRDEKLASKPLDLVAEPMGPKRIALGAPGLVDSMVTSKSNRSLLSAQVNKLTFQNDIEGAFSIEPIRGIIDGMVGTMASFGAQGLDKWKRLPQALQGSSMVISLSGEETISIDVELDDDELSETIVDLMNSSNGGGGNFAKMLPGMGGMSGGGPGGMKMPKMMVTPTFTPASLTVANNIQENDLFSVARVGETIQIRLKRPEGLAELVKALVVDSRNQFEVVNRVGKLTQISNALKRYEAAHGCLPPEGAVGDNEQGLPKQFNWRTGLLKYLDEELYQQFDFDVAWDNEKNLALAQQIPDAFAISGLKNATAEQAVQTRFQIVSGRLGIYGSCVETKGNVSFPVLEKVTDNAKYTSIISEVPLENATHWLSPSGAIDASSVSSGETKLGNENEQGILYVDAKMKVRAVSRSSERIAAVVTATAGDEVGRDDMIKLGN